RPRDVELGLDLAGRDLAPTANQQEEDLEAREVGERLERLDMILASLQPSERKGLHVSKSIIGAGALEAGLYRGWPERDASRLRRWTMSPSSTRPSYWSLPPPYSLIRVM